METEELVLIVLNAPWKIASFCFIVPKQFVYKSSLPHRLSGNKGEIKHTVGKRFYCLILSLHCFDFLHTWVNAKNIGSEFNSKSSPEKRILNPFQSGYHGENFPIVLHCLFF